MPQLGPSGQSPTQVARHFLHLLDDVHRIHGLFQEEIQALRSRVKDLQEANTTLSAALLPDIRGCAVYLVSMDGCIQGWSGGASELYGYSVEEVLGQPLHFLKAEGSSAPAAHPEGHLPPALRRRKDGSRFEVYLHHTLLLDEEGQTAGRMHVEVPLHRQAHGTSASEVGP